MCGGPTVQVTCISPKTTRSRTRTSPLDYKSAATRLELNDLPVSACEPGPGFYFGEGSVGFSSLGDQTLSKSYSAPAVSLPKTTWNAWEKVKISSGHEGAMKCRGSPGFAYTPADEGLSQQGTKFTQGERQRAIAFASPGPNINLRDMPKAEDRMLPLKSKRWDPPANHRSDKALPRDPVLGPGQYDRKDVALHFDTGRSFGICRSAYDKVRTEGSDALGICQTSPGVGPPLWRDLQKDGVPGFKIGTARRFGNGDKTISPGPIYTQDVKSMAGNLKKGSASSDTRRPVSICFGSRPKKPRFRIQLAANTANNGCWGYF